MVKYVYHPGFVAVYDRVQNGELELLKKSVPELLALVPELKQEASFTEANVGFVRAMQRHLKELREENHVEYTPWRGKTKPPRSTVDLQAAAGDNKDEDEPASASIARVPRLTSPTFIRVNRKSMESPSILDTCPDLADVPIDDRYLQMLMDIQQSEDQIQENNLARLETRMNDDTVERSARKQGLSRVIAVAAVNQARKKSRTDTASASPQAFASFVAAAPAPTTQAHGPQGAAASASKAPLFEAATASMAANGEGFSIGSRHPAPKSSSIETDIFSAMQVEPDGFAPPPLQPAASAPTTVHQHRTVGMGGAFAVQQPQPHPQSQQPATSAPSRHAFSGLRLSGNTQKENTPAVANGNGQPNARIAANGFYYFSNK
ncbi:MAG: hypothetical protein SGILL_009784 [Bacillariaceae sp.]